MNNKEILAIAKEMGLVTYNEQEKFFCILGINGHATVINYGENAMISLRDHLIQMGRDHLKMELRDILDITEHH